MFSIERLMYVIYGHMKMIDFDRLYPIGDRWDLGLLEGREGCKLCGNVGCELSENLSPFLTA